MSFVQGKQLPLILQSEKSECGLACLAMLLVYHGHKIDINTLRRKYRISGQGSSIKSITQIAKSLNLSTRSLKLELKEVKRLKLPAILHWDLHHFVILKAFRRNRVIVYDPRRGKNIYSLEQLSQHFSGIAIEVSPDSGFKQKDERAGLSFSELWRHSEGLKKSLFQIFAVSLVLQAFTLSLPFYSQIIIDDVLVNFDTDLLGTLAAGFLCIIIVKSFTEFLRSYSTLALGNMLSLQLGTDICRHLYHLPLGYFSNRHIGDIASRFSSVNKLNQFLCSGVIGIMIDGLMVLGTLILMFHYSRILTTVALVAIVIYILVRLASYGALYRLNEQLLVDSAAENSHFIENIRGIQGIKLFVGENDRLRTWQNRYIRSLNSGIRLEKLKISLNLTNDLLLGTENIVLILVGGFAVMNSQLSIGMLVAYLSFKDQFYTRVFALMDSLFDFKLLDVHLSRLADIVLQDREYDTAQSFPVFPTRGSTPSCLKLQNLGFRYSEASPMLFQGLNMEVGAGESIAIIGPSGLGKSTLLKIILGLYIPTQGAVSFYGRKITEIGLGNYRKNVAAVLQDDCLLSGTILENVTFFDDGTDFDFARECCRLAAIDSEILQMPMQYETPVGDLGNALSGGQIQRLLLARAFYRKPRLLILDEACSNLDLATEKEIISKMQTMQVSRITVAHRPQSFLHADRVYLLKSDGLRKLDEMTLQKMTGHASSTDSIAA